VNIINLCILSLASSLRTIVCCWYRWKKVYFWNFQHGFIYRKPLVVALLLLAWCRTIPGLFYSTLLWQIRVRTIQSMMHVRNLVVTSTCQATNDLFWHKNTEVVFISEAEYFLSQCTCSKTCYSHCQYLQIAFLIRFGALLLSGRKF